jgi:hypothetical protein
MSPNRTHIAEALGLLLAFILGLAHMASAHPAARIKDLREHFADCFQPHVYTPE